MAMDPWHALGGDPRALSEARLLAHHAAQWLTRAARTALDPVPDDSHSNLGWEPSLSALVSHPIGTARIGLRVADLTLLHIGPTGVEAELALDRKTDADAGQWVDGILATRAVADQARNIRLPYEMPDHPVSQGAAYGVRPQSAALGDLASWFAVAHDALTDVTNTCDIDGPGPTPVRCWPHHFDIASLVRLEAGDPETARAIGIGLSPGDESIRQPYFYANPWPPPPRDGLPALSPPGRWHDGGFVGAVARADDIGAMADPRAAVLGFLRSAIDAWRQVLGK